MNALNFSYRYLADPACDAGTFVIEVASESWSPADHRIMKLGNCTFKYHGRRLIGSSYVYAYWCTDENCLNDLVVVGDSYSLQEHLRSESEYYEE